MKKPSEYIASLAKKIKQNKRRTLVLLAGLTIAGFEIFGSHGSAPKDSPAKINEFLNAVKNNQISDVSLNPIPEIRSIQIKGHYKEDNKPFVTLLPESMIGGVAEKLTENNIDTDQKASASIGMKEILSLGMDALFIYMLLGGGTSLKKLMGLNLGKKLDPYESETGVTFDDVAGIDDAKCELTEIVDFLKNPEKYEEMGAEIPHGVLLYGPPGTGKTLLARAVAGEAGVPFFSISGSDFVEMYVGLGASRVRELFEKAKKQSPCLVFIDEIDAVGGRRDVKGTGRGEEHDQTLNALLVAMDGMEEHMGLIIIGATNQLEKLDPALTRPGRFDRKILISPADAKGRHQILEVHTENKPLGDDVDLEAVARMTASFSGADLANLANEAALCAVKNQHEEISMQDFHQALDKIILGVARTSIILTEEQRKLTAYHEAGHALISHLVDGGTKLEKVTIIPHGNAMGVTVSSQEDTYTRTLREMKAMLAHLFGGREAERIVFGDENITTGASNDIKVATKQARDMVEAYGMSPSLGQADFRAEAGSWSEAIVRKVDRATMDLINEAQSTASKLLTQHRDQLDAIATELLSKETITGNEVRAISMRFNQAAMTAKPD